MMEKSLKQGQTHFVCSGKGEPLIFIHGVGLDYKMWKSQIDYFSEHYTVYAIDMLGHGRSIKLKGKQVILEDFTEQLATFCEAVHIDRAHIIGFSMGGMVAQLFGVNYPEKVKTLTIANAVAHRTEMESDAVLERVRLVEKHKENITIDSALSRWFTTDYLKGHKGTVSTIKKRLQENDHESYIGAYRVFATADKQLWDELSNITKPTFIITGEADIGSNPRMAKEMHGKIPNSKLCIVPKARHMLPVEMPNTFNQHVHGFLKSFTKE